MKSEKMISDLRNKMIDIITNIEVNIDYPEYEDILVVTNDMIKNNVSVRRRQRGDYITITSEGLHKKLQDYFVNEKIPAPERDEIPLLCDGAHVMWVLGYRISEHYKINSQTKKVLKVHIFEEKENERDS